MAVFLVAALVQSAFGDFVVFSDDFSTDTTFSYTWFEDGNGGDDNPVNNCTYDASNMWVNITTADNDNIRLGALLSTPIQSGYFQMSFMPWYTYPTDGVVWMRLYGAAGESYSYRWEYAHDNSYADPGEVNQYRAHLEKWVDGTPVVQEVFVPSPDHYDLGAWHTLAMSFGPLAFSGFLDGQLIRTEQDPTAIPIAINSFAIVFRQQDQHLDNILIIGEPYVGPVQPVPLPGAALLGIIGLLYSASRLQRRVS
jgi:hypothetical protein